MIDKATITTSPTRSKQDKRSKSQEIHITESTSSFSEDEQDANSISKFQNKAYLKHKSRKVQHKNVTVKKESDPSNVTNRTQSSLQFELDSYEEEEIEFESDKSESSTNMSDSCELLPCRLQLEKIGNNYFKPSFLFVFSFF